LDKFIATSDQVMDVRTSMGGGAPSPDARPVASSTIIFIELTPMFLVFLYSRLSQEVRIVFLTGRFLVGDDRRLHGRIITTKKYQ
jgi:hypothetical protein